MSQCHKLKTIVKYLIMNKLVEGNDDAANHCIDEFFEFAPYGKGRIRVRLIPQVEGGTLGSKSAGL